MSQTTNTIVMVRPAAIRSNEQTAKDNHYQKQFNVLPKALLTKALEEFDAFVEKLQEMGVNVLVVQDTLETDTPDAHFPNNWLSFHEEGTVTIYPMFAENRRTERNEALLELVETNGFVINNVIDYSEAEHEGIFLEGTGSMVLDRENKIAYCALSERSHEELFIEFCEDFEYTPVIFKAYQAVNGKRLPIYHTNVMMCVGSRLAVICLDSIDDKKERKNVVHHLKESGKEIVTLTEAQLNQFAGNMLQVKGKDKEYLVMSEAAHKSLSSSQLKTIEKHSAIISSSLTTIEACGGGSARCMMVEVFLPKTK
jgi:hypothetical protein